MLEYIKQQLALKNAAMNTQVSDPSDELDDAILEYAHLFEDMGELTMEGHNAVRERPILDIPIEEDIELDSMEMSITSNRIMDIPADITAMEYVYEDQKSYHDFFNEAYRTITRLPRESESHFAERVNAQAKVDYDAYMEYVIQEGLFGNDMLSINDDRVPSSVMVDFGKYSGGNYIAKIPVGFECDRNNKVNINQIHAVTISQNLHVFAHVAEFLRNQIQSNQHINVRGAVWDIATPKMMIVPAFHGTYTVVVKFEIEGGNDEYVQWSISESKIRKSKMAGIDGEDAGKSAELDVSKIQGIEAPVEKYDAKSIDKMNLTFKNKAKPVSEYAAPKKIPSRWNRDEEYYQEAIDFGGGDNGDNPPAADQNATNDNPPAADQNATPDDNGGEPSVDAQPSSVNDVSDAIAAKVSNDTNKEPADLGMDAAPTFETNPDVNLDLDSQNNSETPSEDVNNLEPDTSGTPSDDMGETDNFNTPDVTGDTDMGDGDMDAVNNELNTDDNNTSDDSLGAGSMDNIDDLSIDDLLAKGEEKLKGMSIAQLKDFLNDGLGNDVTATEYAVDEVKHNNDDNKIKNRVNINIRKCLGVLNDDKASLHEIINEFHLNGKKLNNTLSDARRSSEFSDEEKSILNKFNQHLNNLSMKFRANPNDKKGLVALVKEFAQGSKTVVNMCENNGGKQITMEYAMECETDEFGIIQETVTGKIAKEILLWYFLDAFVKRDSPYGTLQFNKRGLLLRLLSPLTLGITGVIAVYESICHEYNMLNDGVDEMVAVELTKDITNAYSLLTTDDSKVSINTKIGKFKKALKNIIDDGKYAGRCSNEKLRKDVMELSSRANVVLNALDRSTRNVDGEALKKLIDAMENVLEGLYDKNKLVNSKVVRDKLNSVKTESAYILDDEDSEYVDESVKGKIAVEALLWYLIGDIVTRDSPYGDLHFNTKYFTIDMICGIIAASCRGSALGFLGSLGVFISRLFSLSEWIEMMNDGMPEIVVTELTKDIVKAYSLLVKDDKTVTIASKVSEFKKALKKIIADGKYADRCPTETAKKINTLVMDATRVRNALDKGNHQVEPEALKKLMDSMEAVMGGMYNKDKLKKLNTSNVSHKLLELNKNKKGGDK